MDGVPACCTGQIATIHTPVKSVFTATSGLAERRISHTSPLFADHAVPTQRQGRNAERDPIPPHPGLLTSGNRHQAKIYFNTEIVEIDTRRKPACQQRKYELEYAELEYINYPFYYIRLPFVSRPKRARMKITIYCFQYCFLYHNSTIQLILHFRRGTGRMSHLVILGVTLS